MKKSTKRLIGVLLASMLLSLTACSGQDAREEIMEIFEITGFTDILTIE